MELAYSIELPANQESVSVGDLQVTVAKTIYPNGWEFWKGKEALFDHLVALVWNRVNLEFSGETHAAREALSVLKSCNESGVVDFLPQLSGSHFYHVYLTAVHGRLLHKAIATGQVKTIEHNPTSTVAFDLLAEAAQMVIKSADRISITETASYLNRFHIGLKKVIDSGTGGLASLGPQKQAENVNEVRGRVILEQLRLLGHDPMNMEYENGGPSIKSVVREKIWQLQPREFAHSTKGFNVKSYTEAFKHAWDWLRESGLISHLPVKKK